MYTFSMSRNYVQAPIQGSNWVILRVGGAHVFIIGRIILYIVCQIFQTAPVYKHYLDFTLLLHAYILLMHCAQCIYIHDILYTLFIFIVDICISVHMYVFFMLHSFSMICQSSVFLLLPSFTSLSLSVSLCCSIL